MMMGGGTTATWNVAVAVTPNSSVVRTTKSDVPTVVGVPLKTPELGSRASPGGSAPEDTDHVYGVAPPEASSWAAYGTPIVPPGSDVLLIVTAVSTSIERLSEPVIAGDEASATVTVNADAVVAVGVPEMAPVCASSMRPGGSDPVVIDQVNGPVPPATVSVAEYNVPMAPTGSVAGVIASGEDSRIRPPTDPTPLPPT